MAAFTSRLLFSSLLICALVGTMNAQAQDCYSVNLDNATCTAFFNGLSDAETNSQCTGLFCLTCKEAHRCDKTCGYCTPETSTTTLSSTTSSSTSTTTFTTATTTCTFTATSTTVSETSTTTMTSTQTSTKTTSSSVTTTTTTASTTSTSTTSTRTSTTTTSTSTTVTSTSSTRTATKTSITTTVSTTPTSTSSTTTTCYTIPDVPGYCSGMSPGVCRNGFCPTCTFAGKCDRSCGYCKILTTTTTTTTTCWVADRQGDTFCSPFIGSLQCRTVFCPTCGAGAGDCDKACGYCTQTTATSTTATTTVTATTKTSSTSTTATVTTTSPTSTSTTTSSTTTTTSRTLSTTTTSSTTRTSTTTSTTSTVTTSTTVTITTTTSSTNSMTSTRTTTRTSTSSVTSTATSTSSVSSTTTTSSCYNFPDVAGMCDPGTTYPNSTACNLAFCSTCKFAFQCDTSCRICSVSTTTTTSKTSTTTSTNSTTTTTTPTTTSTLTTTTKSTSTITSTTTTTTTVTTTSTTKTSTTRTTTFTTITTTTTLTMTTSTTTSTLTSTTTTTSTVSSTSTTITVSTTTTTTLDKLSMYCTLENVDYATLVNHDILRPSFIATVQSQMAAAAGVQTSSVTVTLSPGSVQIHSTIVLPPGSTAADLGTTMQTSQGSLTSGMLNKFAQLPDWNIVATGNVTITGLSYRILADTSTTTTKSSTTTVTTTTSTTSPANTTAEPLIMDPMGSGSGLPMTVAASIGVGVGVAVVILCIICVCGIYYRRKSQPTNEQQDALGPLAEKDVKDSAKFNGHSPTGANRILSPAQTSLSSRPQPESESSTPSHIQVAISPYQQLSTPAGLMPGFGQFGTPSGQDMQEYPGTYQILVDGTAVGPTIELGDVVSELPAGEIVEVLEVTATDDLRRMRGLLRSPPGWISIRSLEPGDTRRWAVRLADPGLKMADGRLQRFGMLAPQVREDRSPASQRAQGMMPPGGMTPGATGAGMFPRVGTPPPGGMFPRVGTPPPGGMLPPGGTPSGMRPMLVLPAGSMLPPSGGMAPGTPAGGMMPLGMALGAVAPWGAFPPKPLPALSAQLVSQPQALGQLGKLTPGSPNSTLQGNSPQGAMFAGLWSDPSGASSTASLPGSFFVGEKVVSKVDFSGAGGEISMFEEGVVVGPARGLSDQRALDRVNCMFPRHPNVNLKVSQLSRVGEVNV